ASRGIDVVVVERSPEEMSHRDPVALISTKLLHVIGQGEFDIVHLHDAWGYGARLVARWRQAASPKSTRDIVTAHGPIDWHAAGNRFPKTEFEIRGGHLERIQAAGADYLVGPSALIVNWLGSAGYRHRE